jgi:cell division protein FtsN
VKRILLLIALLGFGTGAYVLLRPAPTQVVRLEPVTPLPSRLEQPAVQVQPKEKPVSSLKPKPTQQLDPNRRPVISALPQKTSTTRETPSTSTTRETPSTPQKASIITSPKVILGVRQEAGSWRVQAGAFRTQANAEALQAKLQANGLSTRVSQGENGIYRVLVGAYFSSAAARADAPKISSLIPN